MMNNTIEAAAYEAARVAIIPGATADECEQAARRILATAGVSNATFEIVPADLSVDSDSVVVTITADYQDNSIMPPNFLRGAAFESTCELNRERNRALLGP